MILGDFDRIVKIAKSPPEALLRFCRNDSRAILKAILPSPYLRWHCIYVILYINSHTTMSGTKPGNDKGPGTIAAGVKHPRARSRTEAGKVLDEKIANGNLSDVDAAKKPTKKQKKKGLPSILAQQDDSTDEDGHGTGRKAPRDPGIE
jgi:hypothetical protein